MVIKRPKPEEIVVKLQQVEGNRSIATAVTAP